MKAYPEEVRQRALTLVCEVGWGEASRITGVATSTLCRWRSPAAAERDRAASRAAKERRRGVCRDCGARTSLHSDGTASLRCSSCAHAWERANARWTREAIIAVIREYADTHGTTPTAPEWRGAGRPRQYPSTSCIVKVFGGWNAAITAAGFPARKPGQYDRAALRAQRRSAA